EVPIKVGCDDRTHGRVNLRLVEGCPELGNAEDIGYARVLDAVVRVVGAAVLEGAPCDDAAHARPRTRTVLRLGVIERLLVLHADVAGASIHVAEPLLRV